MTLSGLYSYPVKSCAAVPHESVRLDVLGLPWDRHWVVTRDGRFISQRELAALALVSAVACPESLVLRHPTMPEIVVPLNSDPPRHEINVIIWKDTVPAWDEGDAAAGWFSALAGFEVRLMRLADSAARQVNPARATRPATTAFSDGFPLLVATEASLDELNRRLVTNGSAAIPMSRFRPNLVITGAEPFAEDRWRKIRIGEAIIDIVDPSARCIIPSIDQTTAIRLEPAEPLKTLAQFHRTPGGVMFAQNAIHHGPAELRVGDRVEVIAEGPAKV